MTYHETIRQCFRRQVLLFLVDLASFGYSVAVETWNPVIDISRLRH